MQCARNQSNPPMTGTRHEGSAPSDVLFCSKHYTISYSY
jgi:hypothetical protein